MTTTVGNLAIVTPPAEEPVSLAEAKLHLKLDEGLDADDDLISELIAAAREIAESETKRALVTQTWDYSIDRFPWRGQLYPGGFSVADDQLGFRLPKPPLQSVGSVAYLDADGESQTLAADDDYLVLSGDRSLIYPAPGVCWPATQCDRLGAVTVRYTAGYGDASAVPKKLKVAIKMMVGDWYCDREGRGEFSDTVKRLLAACKWGFVA